MDEFDRKRLIEAEWAEGQGGLYTAELNIYASDSKGLVFAMTKIFNEENINMTGLNVRLNKQGKATIEVRFEISSKERLSYIVKKLRNLNGIIDIERTTG